MATPKEQIDEERHRLAATVQAAIREFESRTGFLVAGFSVSHHYSNGDMESDMTMVTNVTLQFPERS